MSCSLDATELPLLGARPISYADAKVNEHNILLQLSYPEKQDQFFTRLDQQEKLIRSIVAHHLNAASPNSCVVAEVSRWYYGSFNVCIPIKVDFGNCRRSPMDVMMRVPLPYKIGEDFCPGNSDEKVRCEAATYAWLNEHCPGIQTPELYGFGFSDGTSFTSLDHLSTSVRLMQSIQRKLHHKAGLQPSNFTQHNCSPSQPNLGVPYLLIEFIHETRGTLLSKTWEKGRNNPTLRTNLFKSLSKMFLSLASTPLSKIGSLTFDDNACLILGNRALSLEIAQLENESTPVGIARDATHECLHCFLEDVFDFHESRLIHQPNAVNDFQDGAGQASALTIMKSIWNHLFNKELRKGPFHLSLTDLHQSNFFVDKDWNITCLVDLEWACSMPIEMIHPPYWLNNDEIDSVSDEEYPALHAAFMNELRAEEDRLGLKRSRLSSVMGRGLENGTFWYSLAMSSPSALTTIFYDKLRPYFMNDPNDENEEAIYLRPGGRSLINRKVKDKAKYDGDLQRAFEERSH